MKSVLKMFTYCAGAENIHTHTREGYWKFWEMGGGGTTHSSCFCMDVLNILARTSIISTLMVLSGKFV